MRSDAGEQGSHTPYDSVVFQLLSPSRKDLEVPVGDETVRVLTADSPLYGRGGGQWIPPKTLIESGRHFPLRSERTVVTPKNYNKEKK